jgi:hypothetical protein
MSYSYTTTSSADNNAAQTACYTLTGLAIVLSATAFWSKGFVPAVLMTSAFASVSFLLAGAVIRFSQALAKGHTVTAGLVVVMALVCLCLEAGLTHYGLDHLNDAYAIAPSWALWPISFGLSLFNVFSQYTFARELKAPRPRIVTPSGPQEYAEKPGDYVIHDDRMTAWERRMAQDPERVKATDPKTAAILAEIGKKVNAG